MQEQLHNAHCVRRVPVASARWVRGLGRGDGNGPGDGEDEPGTTQMVGVGRRVLSSMSMSRRPSTFAPLSCRSSYGRASRRSEASSSFLSVVFIAM